jgi:RNA polymerase sigma-70 factor (ECF subfamily)
MRDSTTASPEVDSVLVQTDELIEKTGLNVAGFQKIYTLWLTRVYQYVYARVGNSHDAEDLTSQIFLKAYEAFPRYKHQGHFAAWLFTIAQNEINMLFRGRKTVEVALDVVEHTDSGQDVLNTIVNSGEIDQLKQIISTLPAQEQELIYLRYVTEMKFSDMALVLGRKEDAIKKSLYRLQTRLRSLLEENHE